MVSYQELCRELSAAGPGCFGELSTTGARSVLRRYSDAWMSTAQRRKAGDRSVRFPRRKRWLMPSRYYAGTFRLDGLRLSIPTARGTPPLTVRLTRPVPYETGEVRSVTLLCDDGRLCVDVTVEIPVETRQPGGQVAGVDLGVIHPYAVVCPTGALLVSGRALRAESRLHLADSKARRRAVARRAPSKGQIGSRRWKKYRQRTKTLERRHQRRISQAQHEAAKIVVEFAVDHHVDTLIVGDPRGLLAQDSGHRQNLAVANWRPGQLISRLHDKAQVAGIDLILVDERGTSSTCPRCHQRVPKPKGRNFTCPACHLAAHRDLVGATNIASRNPRGGTPVDPTGLTTLHRRAGRHLPGRTRRDPRRIAMDTHRSRHGPRPAEARPDNHHHHTTGESLAQPATAA